MIVRVSGDQLLRLDGTRLAELRRAHGHTLRDLGKLLGVSRMTICAWEHERAVPRDVEGLRAVYGHSLEWSGALTTEPVFS